MGESPGRSRAQPCGRASHLIWDQEADPVDHIFVLLSNYLLLREWYGDDLGVLYLK